MMRQNGAGQQLLISIARKIASGIWESGEPVPALRTLAELFGVARATVDSTVREAVRAGLLVTEPRSRTRVAEGGVENARRLLNSRRNARPGTRIAALQPHGDRWPGAAQASRLLDCLERTADRRGWRLERLFWPMAKHGFPRILTDRQFDGAFCIPSDSSCQRALQLMQQRNFPAIVYNHRFVTVALPSVMLDGYAAAQQVAGAFYRQGHRRMCLVARQVEAGDCMTDRQIAGWLDFYRRSDLLEHWDQPVHLLCHPDEATAVRAYFRRRPLPTAVAFADEELFETFCRLDDIGFDVPGELSLAVICGMSDGRVADRYPPVTLARGDLERTAECSLELLGRMIAGEPYPPPLRLPMRLVTTESIGPPPAGN